jgi:hypothetical protein
MQTLISNPFTPTVHVDLIDTSAAVGPASDEAIRRELLSHEAWIRFLARVSSAGLVGVPLFLVAVGDSVFRLLGLSSRSGGGFSSWELLILVVASVSGFIGYRMSVLDPRARLPAAAIQSIGLIGFPVGTLISVGWLYLLLSEKGRRVLSTEYQGVVARTPHIRCGVPRALKVTGMVLFALVALSVAVAMFAM